MAKVAGTASVVINGIREYLRGNMTIYSGDVSRESILGLDMYQGFKETPEVCGFECDLTQRPTMDINVLQRLENITCTVDLINGWTATFRNCNQMNRIALNVDDGKLTVKFEGPSCEWTAPTTIAP